jgi:hypothetical protein
MKRVLFISGSVGLGHVGRDLEIVGTLRKLRPKVEVSWMAESPASYMLQKAGEKLLPETSLLYKANEVLEESAKEYQSNLVQWAMSVRKGWAKNCEVYSKVFESYKFDLLIGDETYDILIAMVNGPSFKRLPFVVIYDILGLDASTWNPVDHIAAYLTNRLWVKFLKSNRNRRCLTATFWASTVVHGSVWRRSCDSYGQSGGFPESLYDPNQ